MNKVTITITIKPECLKENNFFNAQWGKVEREG